MQTHQLVPSSLLGTGAQLRALEAGVGVRREKEITRNEMTADLLAEK